MKRTLAFVALLILAILNCAGSPNGPHKRVEKEAAKQFDVDPIFQEVQFPDEVSELSGYLKDGDRVHIIHGKTEELGYVISTRAKGRYDHFDYSVIFSDDLSVVSVLITTYRSSQGAGICSKGWLKQFKGYQGEELELGKNIDAISGATISATALVTDIKRCHQAMLKLRTLDLLNWDYRDGSLPPSASRS